MKIACRIQQSRHGVYYYRHQFSAQGIRKERRISLKTKNPAIAKEKSLLISAMMIANKTGERMHDNEREILKKIELLNQKELEEAFRNLEIVITPPSGGNISIKADPNNPADIQAMLQASKDFWASEIGQSMKLNMVQSEQAISESSALNTISNSSIKTAIAETQIVAGTPLPDLIEKFATRKKDTLAPKTLYEYRKHQQFFFRLDYCPKTYRPLPYQEDYSPRRFRLYRRAFGKGIVQSNRSTQIPKCDHRLI